MELFVGGVGCSVQELSECNNRVQCAKVWVQPACRHAGMCSGGIDGMMTQEELMMMIGSSILCPVNAKLRTENLNRYNYFLFLFLA